VSTRHDGAVRGGLILAGVLLLAMNLRASITAVGPVLGDIRAELGIGGAAASFLVGVPVIAFAAVSPMAPTIARRVGLEWALGGSLLVLAAATALRSVPIPGAIWVGTAVLGGAIAILNVLIPALVKREYPDRVGPMTGIYSAAQGTVAALAAGLAVPIAGLSDAGWRLSLGVWAGLALIGFAVFLPQIRRRHDSAARRAAAAADSGAPVTPARVGSMWTSPLAWSVTLFLGLQSTIYYTVITWWPTIEHDAGVDLATAGAHQFVFQAAGIAGSLTGAWLLHRLRSQSVLGASLAVIAVVGLVGQMVVPELALVWVVLLGSSGGASITMALSLFGLRTHNHHQAAALSGMAQSVGYLVAALGPILVGALHDATGSWTVALSFVAVCLVGMFFCGILAGRPRYVGDPRS
jgi:CP family cyanate transporter-like MFS transporter